MDYKNDLTELDELREHIALLRDKLRKQEMINERGIMLITQKGINKLNRVGTIYTLFGLFATIYCSIMFHRFGFSDGFVVGTAIFLGVCTVSTAYAHFGLRDVDVASGNLVDIANRLLRLRKIYSRWHFFVVPALVVWCYFLYWDAQRMLDNADGFLMAGLVGGTIGGALGLWRHFKTLREADNAIAHIKDLMEFKD